MPDTQRARVRGGRLCNLLTNLLTIHTTRTHARTHGKREGGEGMGGAMWKRGGKKDQGEYDV